MRGSYVFVHSRVQVKQCGQVQGSIIARGTSRNCAEDVRGDEEQQESDSG
jgi:hypothetical protein